MLSAQETLVINGYIIDAQSSETLISANVYLEETFQGATTNRSGYYSIPDVLPGTYTLVASYIGYTEYRQTITVKIGDKKRIDIEMQPGYVEGQAVIVEAEKSICTRRCYSEGCH